MLSHHHAIAVSALTAVLGFCLAGCSVLSNFYRSPVFDPANIVRDLDNGKIKQGMKDWRSKGDDGGYSVKPHEFHEAGGYLDSSKTYYAVRSGKRQWVETRYTAYHFSYERYQTKTHHYSFYEKDGVLFGVYEWEPRKKAGFFRFNDEKLMQEYLLAVELGYEENNLPITHAVPEEILDKKHAGTGGGQTLYINKISLEEAQQIGFGRRKN